MKFFHATSNQYVLSLSALPHLAYPGVAYTMPIYKNKLLLLLEDIKKEDLEYVEKLCSFCLEETGFCIKETKVSVEEYIDNFKLILNKLPSKTFHQMICEIFSLRFMFREITAEKHSVTISHKYLDLYPLIQKTLEYNKTLLFFRLFKKLIEENEYFSAYLILLKQIWKTLDKFHYYNIFNLEGLFIYYLKWHIIELWMQLHNSENIQNKIDELIGEHNGTT